MILPPAPKRRRNETRDLTHPILVACNRLDGVRLFRPIVLNRELRGASGAGLSEGAADLVGLVRCGGYGRFFALEIKWPGIKPEPDQVKWAESIRRLGGFVAVVHSIDEARDAVERCRKGLSE